MGNDQLNKLYVLYEENKDFQNYVDRYKETHDLLLVDALRHGVVLEYAKTVTDPKYFDDNWRLMRHNGEN